MSDCNHMWLVEQVVELPETSGIETRERCIECQALRSQTKSWTSMLLSAAPVPRQESELMVLKKRAQLGWHKPTVQCSCASCLAEGERLEAQLARHRVTEAA